MIINAPCKINLGLYVLRKRIDGYHDLQTVMMPVESLHDIVEAVAKPRGIVEFSCSGLAVDCLAEDNLCLKAYNLMLDQFPKQVEGIAIHLHKIVPFGAGLGGGSSDATAVIKLIDSLYSLNLSREKIAELASQLGSDTAFFAYNSPKLCEGRGEIMCDINVDLKGLWLTIVKPSVLVSTAQAYRGVAPCQNRTDLREVLKSPLEEWRNKLVNDFETSVFKEFPSLEDIKRDLYNSGALYASMSGSGSAMFALSETKINLNFDKNIDVYQSVI